MANWTQNHDLVYAFVCVSFLADGEVDESEKEASATDSSSEQVVASPDEETASPMDKISETDEDLQKEKPETSEN